MYQSPVPYLNGTTQWPDVTELIRSSEFKDERVTCDFITQKVTTEFAYATTANRTGKWTEGPGIAGLHRCGFEPISAMKNWYSVHSADRWPIIFWWKRIHTGPDVVERPAFRTYWCGDSAQQLHHSGCGFRMGMEPLTRAKYLRYFSLLRMPLEVSKQRQRWLKNQNYRMIAKGTFATFWINGWDPKSWTVKREWAFFKSRKVSIDAHEKVFEYKKRQAKPTGPVPSQPVGQVIVAG